MKLGILSDTHLSSMKYDKMDHGRKVSRFLVRQLESLEWALNEFNKRGVDEIIHCGDVFDSPTPMIYSVVKTKELFKDFTVHAIKGNHDDSCLLFDEKMSALDLLDIDAINTPKTIMIGGKNFVFIPWGYEVDKSFIDNRTENILVAHGFPKNYDGFGSTIKNTEMFDLVLTGHYHKIDEFSRGNTRYLNPGSLSMGRNEVGEEPSVWVLDVDTLEYERIKIDNGIKSIRLNGIPEEFDITEDVYTINVEVMPEQKIVRKLKKNALDVQFRPRQTQQDSIIEKEVEGFWEYVDKNESKYKEEFTSVLEELESEE